MKTRTIITASLLAACGNASAQSGLDLDRAYASELRAESDARSSFLGTGAASNLDVSVLMQARYTANFRDESVVPLGDSDTTLGFHIPRAQVRIAGQVTDNISGKISFDFGAAALNGRSTAGTATLLEAFGVWRVNDGFSLSIGQQKLGLLGEEAVSAEHGLAVERSATNEFFNLGYSQGVAATWTGDNWKLTAAVSDGASYYGNAGAQNSAFTSSSEADYAITGRFEYMVSGNWDQFEDFASWRGSNYGLRLGFGAHWQHTGDTNPGIFVDGLLGTSIELDVAAWTADVMVQGDGWNVFAAYMGQYVDLTPIGIGVPSLVNQGVVVQGGVFVTDQTELFARYDAILLDSEVEGLTGGSESDYHFVTVGVNYFLVPESHAARFTADVVYSATESSTLDVFAPTLGSADPNATGLLGLSDSEFAVRGQLTLVF